MVAIKFRIKFRVSIRLRVRLKVLLTRLLSDVYLHLYVDPKSSAATFRINPSCRYSFMPWDFLSL